ncbi:hypothetical protein [Microscilla marina]|uniref:Uncharacterized protein n=1 Tax=Microscilla marina ATCC 23134 TaxID=313606 RepID=A1ZDV4_MICM2|nr:hypothetical protein [Microscilla marina]EAY31262.1 hypothetical protein M23134_04095 [Microscilla marina ATCC 23134]
MITQTQHLITYLKTSVHPQNSIISSYAKAIEQLGDQEDLQALLELFLQQADNYKYQALLSPIKRRGNKAMADALVEHCFDHFLLKEGITEKVLDCITWLKHPQAEEILWRHFHHEKANYSMHQAACIGLLHFDLSAHQGVILKAIEACVGKNIFDEFVPALVCKITDIAKRNELAERLYESGCTITSTDCNGGIVLGLALSPGRGEELFKKLFWDEYWEVQGGGTGTDTFAYTGLQYLQITIQDLCKQIQADIDNGQDDQQTIHQLRVLRSMLSCRIRRSYSLLKFSPVFTDSLLNVYASVFSWSTPHKNDSLAGLASKLTQGKFNFYKEKTELQLKVDKEILEIR